MFLITFYNMRFLVPIRHSGKYLRYNHTSQATDEWSLNLKTLILYEQLILRRLYPPPLCGRNLSSRCVALPPPPLSQGAGRIYFAVRSFSAEHGWEPEALRIRIVPVLIHQTAAQCQSNFAFINIDLVAISIPWIVSP